MSAKKNLFTSLALCWLLLILSAPTGFAQIEQKVGDKLWVAFPKNRAVFHILVLLTPSRIEQEKLFGHRLAREARDYIRDFKNHPAVQATEKILSNIMSFARRISNPFP